MRTGVIVGKFNLPHLGHLHLINTAAANCDILYVFVCDKVGQTIDGHERARWLKHVVPPHAFVVVTPDDLPDEPEPWAERLLHWVHGTVSPTIDVVFTSEKYGEGFAAALGCEHFLVDLDRETYPISGTQVRQNTRGKFDMLIPPARAALTKRICVVGAESTGKSTLSSKLSQLLKTVLVPEFGRYYCEGTEHTPTEWSTQDFINIASIHNYTVDALAERSANGCMIIDTDANTTNVWHTRYMGEISLDVEFEYTTPSMYILCKDDIPWVQDGTRDSEEHRAWMQQAIHEYVVKSGVPFIEVSGSLNHRIQVALPKIAAHVNFQTFK